MVKDSALIGKLAPSIELPSTPNGALYKLPVGKKAIALFFFPAAGTIGCTIEACSFRDARVCNIVFQRHHDLEIVGISSDPIDKQSGFAEEYSLSYPLLSDVEEVARRAYGVGKQFFGTSPGRETFFISEKGIVKGVCDSSVNFHGHIKFVEKQLVLLEAEMARR